MRIQRENDLLRAFFTSVEKHRSLPAYEAFLLRAEEAGCRGATVLRGTEGTDARGRFLRPHPLSPVQEEPVIVEVVDSPGRIDALLRRAAGILRGRTVTRERAAILVYRTGGGGGPVRVPGESREEETMPEEGPMPEESRGVLLRVFLNESDRHGDRPLVREIVERAAAAGLTGAVVLKSPLGFGTHRTEHAKSVVAASLGQPVVVEVLGSEDGIEGFLPRLDEVLREGLVTMEKVRILRYGG